MSAHGLFVLGGLVNEILLGDVLESLTKIESNSVQCVVTSPPYWGLRDYGVSGQLGLEPTPQEYVATMARVFDEVRRVLKPDGTLWLNVGDSYSASGRGAGTKNMSAKQSSNAGSRHLQSKIESEGAIGRNWMAPPPGFKRKELIGIPWRLAFALQDAGWYLRQDIIWAKRNPMPESVTDRCTKAHEYLFLLSKSATYYFDQEAIKESAESPKRPSKKRGEFAGKTETIAGRRNAFRAVTEMRNKRSVWTLSNRPFRGAHFATFPPDLVAPCILAGSRAGDVVLDPFMGSGTTAAVAEYFGRNWIGCELNSTYAALLEERRDSVRKILDKSAWGNK